MRHVAGCSTAPNLGSVAAWTRFCCHLLPDRHFDEAGRRAYHQEVQSASAPTRRAGGPPLPFPHTHPSCHGRTFGDADADHESRTRAPRDSEPAGTVDQLCLAAANGISDHNRTSNQNQATGGYQFSVPSTGRSHSVGSESRVVQHRSTPHVGHCTTEHSRTDLGESLQRSSGYGNMSKLTRVPSLSALSGVSVCATNPDPHLDARSSPVLLPTFGVSSISGRRGDWATSGGHRVSEQGSEETETGFADQSSRPSGSCVKTFS